MKQLFNAIAAVGVLESMIFIGGIVYAAILWVRGVSPALLRLGNGIAKRKIALFAKQDHMISLKSLLTDSKLFRSSNIIEIGTMRDLGRAESATIFLLFWHDWVSEIDGILEKKADRCALIVYAPYEKGRIPDAQMTKLDAHRHTTVTNFRGRLLNDIMASMITTSYES